MSQMTFDHAFQIAVGHHQAGRLQEAESIYRQILAVQPKQPDALHLLGMIAGQVGRYEIAADLIRQAIAIVSDNPNYYSNLGNVLLSQSQFDQTIACCRQALALKPDFAEAHYNLGNAFMGKSQIDQAIACWRRALELKPNDAESHLNLAIAMFLKGDLSQAWPEYEWRWKCKHLTTPRRDFPQPQWDGGDLGGRTILLHAEQGFGDAIQFLRYVRLVSQRGGRILVECQPELCRLLRNTPDVQQWIERGQPLPAFDVHCPLLSLPMVFGTTLQNIPPHNPVLSADAEDTAVWRKALADGSDDLKVGLVWAGSTMHKDDRNRSIPLSTLAPLGRVKGVRFYSLQKGAAAAHAKNPPPGLDLIDRTEDIKDFADTAALIANLDLVISVDTAVVHLAGAMGKEVWTLLPFVPDWRWMLNREDSPWYPSMRLFRQKSFGDWADVVARVADALAIKARDHSSMK